jgi:hypothetical protein
VRRILFVLLLSALLFAIGCGGGSSSSSVAPANTSTAGGNTIVTAGDNVAPLIVDAGPPTVASSNSPSANVAFTTVTVCAPGSNTNCVMIDHIAVDTGSTGLRIPVSLLSALNLPNVNPSTPIAECVQFLDNTYFWGTVKSANVSMGGSSNSSELASSVPIHVMGDTSIPTAPSTCSTVTTISGTTMTGTEEDTVLALGANGLLGVGTYQFDCDVLGFANPCATSSNPPSGVYYTCSSTTCSPSAALTTQQVRNPVSLFAADNNGVIIELPAVPVGGQTGISAGQGSMVFGIGTQANNGLSSSAVTLTLDSNSNDAAWMGVTTVFNGVSYPNSIDSIGSFLDSGSNALFFLDQPTSGIPACGDFYCPGSTDSLTAVNKATGGNSHGVQFNVSNADALFTNNAGNSTAFSDLAGPNTSGVPDSATQVADGYFDWGLPFFYGRNVYTAIWGVTPPTTPVSGTSVPAGPFWAY